MSKALEVQLSEDEARFILAALDRSQIQGLGTARMVLQIAEKLGKAGATQGIGTHRPTIHDLDQSTKEHNGVRLEKMTT